MHLSGRSLGSAIRDGEAVLEVVKLLVDDLKVAVEVGVVAKYRQQHPGPRDLPIDVEPRCMLRVAATAEYAPPGRVLDRCGDAHVVRHCIEDEPETHFRAGAPKR